VPGAPEWNFVQVLDASDCGESGEGSAWGAEILTQRVNVEGNGTFFWDTIATGAGLTLMDEIFAADYFSDGDGYWGIYDSNDRGLQTGSFADVDNGTVITVTLRLWSSEGQEPDQLLDEETFTFVCGAAPAETETIPVPGCDLLNIPATAVVGTFVEDTPLYYAPGQMIIPQEWMDTAQSLWVLGVDATGEYYKVILACGTYWAPVSTLGPTYDDVWLGKALPTNVVE
jgi:hypothetical protein